MNTFYARTLSHPSSFFLLKDLGKPYLLPIILYIKSPKVAIAL